MDTTEASRKAYSVDEFCRTTGLSRSTAKRLIAEQRIRVVRVGRRVLIPASEIDQLLDAETGNSAA
jgi:excisionase family DNA binding protein